MKIRKSEMVEMLSNGPDKRAVDKTDGLVLCLLDRITETEKMRMQAIKDDHLELAKGWDSRVAGLKEAMAIVKQWIECERGKTNG